MEAPMYTTCVDREDYKGISFTPEIIIAAGSLIFGGPVGVAVSLVTAMEALHKVCEYILHGKLVCLGGDRCAIGRVAEFDTVKNKSFPDTIDNDFSINLLLAPYDVESLQSVFLSSNELKTIVSSDTPFKAFQDKLGGNFTANYELVSKEPKQGSLIKEQDNMPEPRDYDEEKQKTKYVPTSATFLGRSYKLAVGDSFLEAASLAITGLTAMKVPVLHCEIEGERAHLVCAALDFPLSLIPGGSKVCRWKPLGIPLGRWACAIVSTLLLPFILPALLIAWAAGSDDNRDFDKAGDLSPGDPVIIRGRWVYDAAHSGWNELHPVVSVQKLSSSEQGELEKSLKSGNFGELYDRWCQQSDKVPLTLDPRLLPFPLRPPETLQKLEMTLEQQFVYDQQRRPENRWLYHPAVDGCGLPSEPPLEPPSEPPPNNTPPDPVIIQ